MTDPHHVRQVLELVALGPLLTLVVHFAEFGSGAVHAAVRRTTASPPIIPRVLLRLSRLATRAFAATMLLAGLVYLGEALKPAVELPSWASQAAPLAVVLLALSSELLWNGAVARSLQRWEKRCRHPEMLAHHGDNARTVGWRVARSASRYGALSLGLSIAPLTAVVLLLREAPAGEAMNLIVLVAVLATWAPALVAAEFAVTLLDPLARLVQRSWFDLHSTAGQAELWAGSDAVLSPLHLQQTARQRTRQKKRRSTRIAALALRRTAQRYPTGTRTEDGRVALLAELAGPSSDFTEQMRRIVDAIIYEEIPDTTIGSDIAERSMPPLFDRARPWLLGATAFLVALVPLLPAVVRPALDVYAQMGR
ncbi:hypothetical protein ACFJIY_17110 [Pimelobacter simplex]|uniref:hypothetical protein n=1 Tax=Nocardioides simplex TaxID=2045 RepID=UPI00366E2DA0